MKIAFRLLWSLIRRSTDERTDINALRRLEEAIDTFRGAQDVSHDAPWHPKPWVPLLLDAHFADEVLEGVLDIRHGREVEEAHDLRELGDGRIPINADGRKLLIWKLSLMPRSQ